MLNFVSKLFSAVVIAAAVAVSPVVAGDLQEIIASGKVRIGVPVDVPPFGSVDSSNEAVGLDVDMANMIATALGVELELQQITGANRVPYLVTDRLDIVMAAMGATAERALSIAFASPYSALSSGVFGPSSIDVTSAQTLGTHTVAVARGTTQDLKLTVLVPEAKIVRFDDDATAAAAFLSGQAELLATADVVAKSLADSNPGTELKAKFILEFAPTYIGIQQGNPDLLRWLDTFVHINMRNGTLSGLSEKWLGNPLSTPFPAL